MKRVLWGTAAVVAGVVFFGGGVAFAEEVPTVGVVESAAPVVEEAVELPVEPVVEETPVVVEPVVVEPAVEPVTEPVVEAPVEEPVADAPAAPVVDDAPEVEAPPAEGPKVIHKIPDAPTFVDVCGWENDGLEDLPADHPHYTYNKTGEGEGELPYVYNRVVVWVLPADGFVFPEGVTTRWEHVYDHHEPCPVEEPVEEPAVVVPEVPAEPAAVVEPAPVVEAAAVERVTARPALAETGFDSGLAVFGIIVLAAGAAVLIFRGQHARR